MRRLAFRLCCHMVPWPVRQRSTPEVVRRVRRTGSGPSLLLLTRRRVIRWPTHHTPITVRSCRLRMVRLRWLLRSNRLATVRYVFQRPTYRPVRTVFFLSCVCEFFLCCFSHHHHMWAGYGAMQGHAPVPSRRSRSPSRRRSGSRHSERHSPVRDEYDHPSGRSSRDRFVILPYVCSKHVLTCRLCRRFFRDVRDDFRPKGRFSRSSSPVCPPRRRRRTEKEPMDPERKRLSILEQLERHYGRLAVQTSTPKRPDASPRKEASGLSYKTSA